MKRKRFYFFLSAFFLLAGMLVYFLFRNVDMLLFDWLPGLKVFNRLYFPVDTKGNIVLSILIYSVSDGLWLLSGIMFIRAVWLKNVFHFSTGFYIPVNSVYVFYFLLGHYIHHYNININIKLLTAVIIFYLVYAALMPLNTEMILTASSGRLISLEQDSPIIVLVSTAFFCLFHQLNKTNRLISFLAPLCFGIYLIHPLFLFSLYLFLGFTPEKCPLVLFILTTCLFTALPSIGFSYCAEKIVSVFCRICGKSGPQY